MTDDLVARLRDRLAKATPGEWEIVPYGDGDSLVIHSSANERVCFMATPSCRDEQRRRKSWREIKSNADLICDLRNNAPALLDELEALRAENARLRAGGWQPIETAPRDRHIWLATPYHMRIGYWAQGAGHENHGTKGGGWIDFAMEEAGGVRGLRFAPTHWQPLPAPPATGEKE